jgi:hypothetical protein
MAKFRLLMLVQVVHMDTDELQPFNAGIKSRRATLTADIFYWGFNF